MPEISEGAGALAHSVRAYVATKWPLLVADALVAATLRFGQVKSRVAGGSQKMLAQTLCNRERDGIVDRTAYATVPPRGNTA
ncbi:winged helix-turn-helix transcriptional regulator [Streptomyces sp. ICBB 8177]|uniref:winged helix-turn-helix transcriptional regulator n=1 Tax=Streptomyces sp. ICBB 8177 TaxID=563922 RepID=UPI00130543AE|nr:winged helix-turn-helix transcriptional regulator [Streptomyces sp. ICBB 8177]